jgi:hypothetical protein
MLPQAVGAAEPPPVGTGVVDDVWHRAVAAPLRAKNGSRA